MPFPIEKLFLGDQSLTMLPNWGSQRRLAVRYKYATGNFFGGMPATYARAFIELDHNMPIPFFEHRILLVPDLVECVLHNCGSKGEQGNIGPHKQEHNFKVTTEATRVMNKSIEFELTQNDHIFRTTNCSAMFRCSPHVLGEAWRVLWSAVGQYACCPREAWAWYEEEMRHLRIQPLPIRSMPAAGGFAPAPPAPNAMPAFGGNAQMLNALCLPPAPNQQIGKKENGSERSPGSASFSAPNSMPAADGNSMHRPGSQHFQAKFAERYIRTEAGPQSIRPGGNLIKPTREISSSRRGGYDQASNCRILQAGPLRARAPVKEIPEEVSTSRQGGHDQASNSRILEAGPQRARAPVPLTKEIVPKNPGIRPPPAKTCACAEGMATYICKDGHKGCDECWANTPVSCAVCTTNKVLAVPIMVDAVTPAPEMLNRTHEQDDHGPSSMQGLVDVLTNVTFQNRRVASAPMPTGVASDLALGLANTVMDNTEETSLEVAFGDFGDSPTARRLHPGGNLLVASGDATSSTCQSSVDTSGPNLLPLQEVLEDNFPASSSATYVDPDDDFSPDDDDVFADTTAPASGGSPTDAWEELSYNSMYQSKIPPWWIVASDGEDPALGVRNRIAAMCANDTLGVVFTPVHGVAESGKRWLSETVHSGLDKMQHLQSDEDVIRREWRLFDNLPASTKDIMQLAGDQSDIGSLCFALKKLTSFHKGEIVELEMPTWSHARFGLPLFRDIPSQMQFKPDLNLPDSGALADSNIEQMSPPCRPNWDKQVCSWCVPCLDETVGHWTKTVRVATLGELFYNLAPFHAASDIYDFYQSQPRLSLKMQHGQQGGGAKARRGLKSVLVGSARGWTATWMDR